MELDNFKQKLEALQNIFIKNNHIEHIHGNGKELVNNDFIPISHDFSDGLYMRKMQMKKKFFCYKCYTSYRSFLVFIIW